MIKSPIKLSINKYSVCSWIIEKFPEDYEKLRYIEPFVGNGLILLNKNKSQEEVAGDIDPNIISIWRIMRDENKNFRNKISKLSYTEKYFNLVKNKKYEKDYFKEYFFDFVLRKMSKNGQKNIFDSIERKKINKFWKDVSENISSLEERIKDVYFINKNPIDIINGFSNPDCLCYCCPPPFLEKNSQMTTDEYVQLTDSIKSFRGKVVFYGNNCSFYKRILSDWKIIKNKNNKNKDFIWINF